MRTSAVHKVALAPLATVLLLAGMAEAAGGVGKRDCGPAIRKSSGASWKCTFADHFKGTGLNPANWAAQRTAVSGYTSGLTACFVDSPNNVSVSGGVLKLTARREAAPFTCRDPHGAFNTQYTSGMVTSAEGRFSQTYGRFEVRARVPGARVRGLQTTLWLYPEQYEKFGPWPASGEIDIAEMFSVYPDRAIPYVHYNSRLASPSVTNTRCMIKNLSAFHRYAVVWTRTAIKTIYDGRNCDTVRWQPAFPLAAPQPFNQPFFIALTQALGIGANAFDPALTPLPATTEIDYVRAWK